MSTRPIAAVLGVSAAMAACDPSVSGDCVGTAVEEAISPDGRYVATLFHQECGPAAELSTGLSIRDARVAFDPAEQPAFLTIEGQREFTYEWSTARSLSVSLPQAGAVIERADTWRDVRVDYE